MRRRCLCGFLAIILVLALLPVTGIAAETYTDMKVSEKFIELLKKMEGFSGTPYFDYGQYTFGYGTRCPDDMVEYYKENPLTEKQAEVLLREELLSFEASVNSFAKKYNLNLAQHQYDALVSFSFNCGAGWTKELSGHFNSAIRSGDTSNIFLNAMMLWAAAGGKYILVNRRMWEANMYINGVYNRTGYPNNFRYVHLDGNGGTLRYKIAGFDSNNPAPAICEFSAIPTGVDSMGNPFVYELAGWSTSATGGTLITVLDESVVSGSTLYAQWVIPEGITEAIPGVEPADNIEITVTGEVVNIRSGPGEAYEILSTVASGEILIVTATKAVEEVLWGQTEKGWICLTYTNYEEVIANVSEYPKMGTVNGNSVRIRVLPGTGEECTVVGSLSTGARVEILEEYAETLPDRIRLWGKMSDGNWICLDYVVFDSEEDESTGDDQPQTGTLTSISILKEPYKKQYVQMQDFFDPSGGVVVYHYSDGSIQAKSLTRGMVSGFSNENLGTVTLTITSSGKSTTYDVEIIMATVTFLNYDGTVLSSLPYAYGETVAEPETPVKPTDENGEYKFMGWDKAVTACDGDVVYTAVFHTLHTVTFQNYDGSVLSSTRYAYGEAVTPPEVPPKPDDENGTYRFVGWDQEVTACKGDAQYTAVFKPLYTVTFLNYDGTVISTAQYVEGEKIVPPENPQKPSDEQGNYRFAGWDREVTACSGDAQYTAVFETVYTVTFVNDDGTVISSGQYAAGETVTIPEAPTKPAEENVEHRFVGWDQEVTACSGDAVYTAVYKTLYTVTFRNEDGTLISSGQYAAGETVTIPEDPAKPADENGEYRFVGWSPEVIVCEGPAAYTAVFELVDPGPQYPIGDLDQNNAVNEDDAIYLLRHVVFPDKYPIDAEADFNGDGIVNEDDAIYLLRHVVFPDKYPLMTQST